MRILFLSALASQGVIADAHKKDPKYAGYAVQKFSRLLAEGMSQNGTHVTSLSSFYLPSSGKIWHHHKEDVKGVHYKYIPSIIIGPVRHLWLILYCFFYVLFWGLTDKKHKAIICDILNISSCLGSVAAARLIGLKRVGVVTDIPGLVPGKRLKDVIDSKQVKLCMKYLPHFTHYLLLTEQMNGIVNLQNKPYMIMEGLVDSEMVEIETRVKEEKRIALYAGGLREGYGLRLLVEGFINADVDDSELWIYGYGPFADDLREYEKMDDRVKYFGIRPNEEIVETEMRVSLLINPRPTHEELTQYSFPSKNMEYMVSGTPLLTTILPGMPKEYHSHVYLFDQGETVEGYSKVIKNILNLPKEELIQKGKEARQWVLDNKNNIKQAKRVVSFISNS